MGEERGDVSTCEKQKTKKCGEKRTKGGEKENKNECGREKEK